MSSGFRNNSDTYEDSFLGSNRGSIDESVDLDDDLALESETGSITPREKHSNKHSDSYRSIRRSMESEGSYLSPSYFQMFNDSSINDSRNTEFSPLGPNSIHELTVASKVLELKRRKAPKRVVTINGGATTVHNLASPSVRDIPQIRLPKLKQKISDSQLKEKYIDCCEEEYKKFDLSYKQLTEDALQIFAEQEDENSGNADSASVSSEVQENDKNNDKISDIPPIFFDENFRLDDPRIYEKVIGKSGITSFSEGDYDEREASSVPKGNLQENLSKYLDIVEVHLIKEISKTSNSFFDTLVDIKDVQTQTERCSSNFDGILNKLSELQLSGSERGLNILKKIKDRKNIDSLESTMLQLSYILRLFELSKKSLRNEKYEKGLNECLAVEKLIEGSTIGLDDEYQFLYPKLSSPYVNLKSFPPLSGVISEVRNLKNECSMSFIESFISFLLGDLHDHYELTSYEDTLKRLLNSMSKKKKNIVQHNRNYMEMKEEKRSQLKRFVFNLSKSGNLNRAYAMYLERIINEIKAVIRNNLPSTNKARESFSDLNSALSKGKPSGNPYQQESNSSLVFNLRTMSDENFILMLNKIFANISECCRRLTLHQKNLLDFALTIIPQHYTKDVDVMALDIGFAINKAIEISQVRLAKIINVRLDQIADSNVEQYLRLYALTSAYLNECELINPGFLSSGAGSSLSDWLKNHVNYFIHRYHLNALMEFTNACNKEVWREETDENLLQRCQKNLDEIISYVTYVESKGLKGNSVDSWLAFMNPFDNEGDSLNKLESSEKELNGQIWINHDSFIVPPLTLLIVRQTKDYLILHKFFSQRSSLMVSDIIQFFELVNLRSAQAILNAGATRTAGLRSILTKNITLCIRLTEFDIKVLESIRTLEDQDSGAPSSREFTSQENHNFAKVIDDSSNFENDLFMKLVTMMQDRVINHCNTIAQLDFSKPFEQNQQCHSYMEILVKNTLSVSKTLSTYLPELKISFVLLQIFDIYKNTLTECYCTRLPQFKSFDDKYSLLKDIDYFRVKLSDLPGYGNSGQIIWENVNALPTIEDVQMEQKMKNEIEEEKKEKSAPETNK